MPLYKVWYRNNQQPLEFSSASICREDDIVARILAHEKLSREDGQNLQELVARNKLAPVRYTEDESEPQTIA